VRDVLREYGRLTAEQALTIIDPVLQALDAAHHAGFVHRDVKPENVLLTDDGKVKVADFGLARAISAATSTAATQGLLIGTVAYLSPEQVQRGIADARSDVYGAGILLYEMVTGSVPFAGETPLAVAYQHVNAAVPAPSSIRPGVPASLDAIVARATARDADDRYPSAAAFLAAVREAKRGMPVPRPFGVSEDQAATLVVPMATAAGATGVTAPVATGNAASAVKPRRRRRRGWIGLLAVLLVGALVAGGAWVYGAARTVTMPSVVGLTPTAAAAKLTPLHLSLDSGATDFSETVAPGKIISTDPKPGTPAKQDSTVSAVVSRGPERHAVPVVAGMTVGDATAAIGDASLTVGAPTQAYDEKIPVGDVVTTNPAPAAALKRGQAVSLVLSKGPAPVKLPSYVGQPADKATAALEKSGMKVTSTSAYSKTVADGSVVSMTPTAGKTVPKGTTVALVVSKGPPLVTVPSVVDKFEPEAKRILIAAGFKVNAIYPLIATPIDRVLSQSAKAGSQLPWGSTITISVV